MVQPNEIIQLSKQAFWDVDMAQLDYKKQANAVIRRVFDNGSWEDLLEVVNYYGKENVIFALTSAPYLKEITAVFASKLFHIPFADFKCSTTRQFHPIL